MDTKKQQELELLVAKHAVYSSEKAYGDIIVPRASIVEFIKGLTKIGITIDSLDWWCNATDENTIKYGCPHGYGGPLTEIGWFSEMCHDFDDISEIENELFFSLANDFKVEIIENINANIIDLIQKKRTITFANGTFLTFAKNSCLTPGFNLLVPNDWTRAINE